ncbi:MAG: helix-turn-helix transcriptional regulator [Candidatus Thermoplasmatota archaeon]|nr:helix-turn-helix transcriptional regulator [Candidatus Thermoplasmatota archaeon]MBS3789373.1 helix-turn-helix transcriptional regulator [Candidatus Thermoplasmatota archaeon]
MEDKLEKIKKLLDLSNGSDFDKYAEKNLKNRLYKWKNADIEYLSDLEYFINGKKYSSLFDAFYEVEDIEKMKLRFLNPNLDGPWNFSKPTKELKEKGCKGVCKTFEYDPTSLDKWSRAKNSDMEKVMIRAFIEDFYVPISINTKSKYHHAEDIPRQYCPRLKELRELWEDIRNGVVPFVIRLCIYTKKDRYPLLLDVIDDKLKPHPLGKITRVKRVDRGALEYMNFDKVYAWIDLPLLTKKIFELLFETQEMTIFDLADRLKLDKAVAENNLSSLETKGLVNEKKEISYEINMDRIEEIAEGLD